MIISLTFLYVSLFNSQSVLFPNFSQKIAPYFIYFGILIIIEKIFLVSFRICVCVPKMCKQTTCHVVQFFSNSSSQDRLF